MIAQRAFGRDWFTARRSDRSPSTLITPQSLSKVSSTHRLTCYPALALGRYAAPRANIAPLIRACLFANATVAMFLFRRSTNSRIQRLRASALVDFRAAAAVAFTGPTPQCRHPKLHFRQPKFAQQTPRFVDQCRARFHQPRHRFANRLRLMLAALHLQLYELRGYHPHLVIPLVQLACPIMRSAARLQPY